jgi:hypothetical protein
MSKLETNTIDTVSGTSNLVIGSTNTSTITMPNGALSGQNYPAFMATMGTSNQNVTDATTTKVQLTNEVIDTDNAFDNSTNYRFTVPSGGAGKYLINGAITLRANATSISTVYAYLYKNGSGVNLSMANFTNSLVFITTQNFSVLIDLVAGDYLELFGYVDGSGTTAFDPGVSSDTVKSTYLAGYRIGA